MVKALFLLLAVVPAVLATRGVDVSSEVLPTDWKCLLSEGYDFAIIRAYESVGRPDSTAPHTVYNAWAGGMAHVDVYMFPCYSCGNPAGQVDSMLAYLEQFNITSGGQPPGAFGMVWLDIEGPQYWSKSTSDNSAFIEGLIKQAKARGINVGVYTSDSQWVPITGDAHIAPDLPLWYPHYDDSPSFSDFSPFGGWSKPSIKQFRGDATVCGVGIDENWY